MNMIRSLCILVVSFLFLICASEGFSAPTYTPAPQIYMTGQSLSGGVVQARFDVAAALIASNASIAPAHLETSTIGTSPKTFSGAFYLSGAGWVDIKGVTLDCGGQLLTSLDSNTPCTLSGMAQSEVVGDVLFDGTFKKIQYQPKFGTLSGTISSNIGDFSLSGVILPLKESSFINSTAGGIVDSNTSFEINNPGLYMSSGGLWKVDFIPTLASPFPSFAHSSDGNFLVDLSLAATYDVKITDPNGSTTFIPGYYTTKSLTPSFTHTSAAFIENLCHTDSYPSYCPDGATLSPSILSKYGSSPVVADGNSYYDFSLKLRDQYGNRVTDGLVEFQYNSSVYFDQSPSDGTRPPHPLDPISPYPLKGKYVNDLFNPLIFNPTITAGADIKYGFASYAPTLSLNSLILSKLTYKDISGIPTDLILNISDTMKSIEFSPLFSTSIAQPSDDIIIGKETSYQIEHTPNVSSVPTTNKKDILLFFIGDIGEAGLDSLSSTATQCSKNAEESPTSATHAECYWGYFLDKFSSPSVLTTTASSFSGTYIPYVVDPDLEEVSYRSYIQYNIDGHTVIYPSTSGSLGKPLYDDSLVKIFGQNNVGKQYGGISTGNGAEIWNKIHKNIMTLSRNRTAGYNDVDYNIESSDQSIDNSYFNDITHKKKRSLIVIGHNITITDNIALNQDHPLSIMALTDVNGSGGNIFIDPGVKNIAASLFAEHAIQSSNPVSSENQLSIYGSVVSRNTMGETLSKICPFFVTSCTTAEAKKYDLEKLREGYTKLPANQATLGRAQNYPNTVVIIEYDGRIQFDPPVGF